MKYTIEQARILGGYNQLDIAPKLGMSEKTYIQYEKYRKVMRMDTAQRFSELTRIDLGNIIFFNPELQIICSKRNLKQPTA